MISFPCTRCGEPLSVPEDMAGDEIQCPVCHSLPTVPTLDDLPYLQRDGTLGIKPMLTKNEPDRLENLARTFGRRHVDDDGNEIDNRGSFGSASAALPVGLNMPTRYDPETGEPIRPFAVRQVPTPAVPIAAAPAAVDYATPAHGLVRQSVWMALFQPTNALVLFIVWIAHVAGTIMDGLLQIVLSGISVLGFPLIPSWLFNVLFWLAVAHYANVIYETGSEERDELPRPLRQLEFTEDIIKPGARAVAAFLLAYLPLFLTALLPAGDTQRVAVTAALVMGGLLLPAMLLCACGSGSVVNLRPDRVIRTIAACGVQYWLLAVLAIFTVPLYLWAATSISLFRPVIADTKAEELFAQGMAKVPMLLMPVLAVGVYLFHGICWRLGQLQRVNNVQSNWAWEVHEKQRLEERRRRQAERAAKNG